MRAYISLGLVAVLAGLGAACSGGGATPTPTPTAIQEATPTPTEAPEATTPPAGPQELMEGALLVLSGDATAAARMGETGDESYIPVLVNLLRLYWRLDEEATATVYSSLARLSSQSYEQLGPEALQWSWWVDWLGSHPEVQAPEGYAAWRGELFSRFIDEEMGALLYDGVKSRIRVEEIVWGGVPKDGIPDLTDPPVVPADEAYYLSSSDRVFGVSINGEHRAYPLRVLNEHEMVNDVLGGVPFALAY